MYCTFYKSQHGGIISRSKAKESLGKIIVCDNNAILKPSENETWECEIICEIEKSIIVSPLKCVRTAKENEERWKGKEIFKQNLEIEKEIDKIFE